MKNLRLFIVFILFALIGLFAFVRDQKVKASENAAVSTGERCLALEEAHLKKAGHYYDNADRLRQDMGALPAGIKMYFTTMELPPKYSGTFQDTDAPFLGANGFRILVEITNSPESGGHFYVLLPRLEPKKFDVL